MASRLNPLDFAPCTALLVTGDNSTFPWNWVSATTPRLPLRNIVVDPLSIITGGGCEK